MRTVGLLMVIFGLALMVLLPIVGACCHAAWSTPSAVLFGLGVAYAGFCGRRAGQPTKDAAVEPAAQ